MVSHLGYHERILFAETSVVKLYIYKKTKLEKTAAIKDTTKKKANVRAGQTILNL